MKLKDAKFLFGVAVSDIKSKYKVYSKWLWIICIIDIALILSGTVYLFYHGSGVGPYGVVCAFVVVAVNVACQLKLDDGLNKVYKFYKRHSKCMVTVKCLNLNVEGFRRVFKELGIEFEEGISTEQFMSGLNDYCKSSPKRAIRVSSVLSGFDGAGVGGFRVCFIQAGKTQMFVGFPVDEDKEEVE